MTVSLLMMMMVVMVVVQRREALVEKGQRFSQSNN
jgi:hypothetical protein